MSTRGTVSIVNSDGSIESIYSHFDSYLEGLGDILFHYYDNEASVRNLIALGDASFIDATLDDSIFYKRDRGESDTDAKKFINISDSLFQKSLEEYNYLFLKNKWYISNGEPIDFKELKYDMTSDKLYYE